MKKIYALLVLVFMIAACGTAPEAAESTAAGFCPIAHLTYYVSDPMGDGKVEIVETATYPVTYRASFVEGANYVVSVTEDELEGLKIHADNALTQVQDRMAEHGYHYFASFIGVDYSYLSGVANNTVAMDTAKITEDCVDGALDISAGINLFWDKYNWWGDDNQLDWEAPFLWEMLHNENLENVWIETDPATITEPSYGSFRIVWGSYQSDDLSELLHQLPGVTIYYLTQDGVTFGTIVKN